MRIYWLFILVLWGHTAVAQPFKANKYPAEDFRYPLDIAPSFAGIFGDLRPNHFHSGLDFRTNQREGYPIYAVADGYISRLRVQIGGFGQAIYMDHPNGYTSVYAHLKAFAPLLATKVKNSQYERQTFELDTLLPKTEILVKKGELIGYTGNTGSSGGPHLHFEIRDTQTEEAINPQLFGFTTADTTPPEFKALYIYSLKGEIFSESTTKRKLTITKSMGTYRVELAGPIPISGETGFGISALDRINLQGNAHGLYSIELSLDEQVIYSAKWERFSFDHTKAINSHLDYFALKAAGTSIHKSFIDLGNPLKIYDTGTGRIHLKDDQVHQLKYRISDVAGNTSELLVEVKRAALTAEKSIKKPTRWMRTQTENDFLNDAVRVLLPAGTLYNDIDFNYSKSSKLPGTFSAQHRIHTGNTPIHQAFTLSIRADENLPNALQNKTLVVDSKGKASESTFEKGWVSAQVKQFGTYHIAVDTIPPSIQAISFTQGTDMRKKTKIIFKIADSLSGIGRFEGRIDGQWVLVEYDQKTNTLWHQFDERTTTGKHAFELNVIDKKGNSSNYKTSFTN